jgi:hypothetical protein
MLSVAVGILIAAFAIVALLAVAFIYRLVRVGSVSASEPVPKFFLRMLWCVLWSLSNLFAKFKPAWYTGRAIVRLFGFEVDGIPGKEFSIDVTPKSERDNKILDQWLEDFKGRTDDPEAQEEYHRRVREAVSKAIRQSETEQGKD